jgi:hypothetical protein
VAWSNGRLLCKLLDLDELTEDEVSSVVASRLLSDNVGFQDSNSSGAPTNGTADLS